MHAKAWRIHHSPILTSDLASVADPRQLRSYDVADITDAATIRLRIRLLTSIGIAEIVFGVELWLLLLIIELWLLRIYFRGCYAKREGWNLGAKMFYVATRSDTKYVHALTHLHI